LKKLEKSKVHKSTHSNALEKHNDENQTISHSAKSTSMLMSPVNVSSRRARVPANKLIQQLPKSTCLLPQQTRHPNNPHLWPRTVEIPIEKFNPT